MTYITGLKDLFLEMFYLICRKGEKQGDYHVFVIFGELDQTVYYLQDVTTNCDEVVKANKLYPYETRSCYDEVE